MYVARSTLSKDWKVNFVFKAWTFLTGSKNGSKSNNYNNNNNNNNNNGNFICVFECTIVNPATYRQFTNAAWDGIIKKKTKQNKNRTKAKKEKNSKLH